MTTPLVKERNVQMRAIIYLLQAILAGGLNFFIQILPSSLACQLARSMGNLAYVFASKRKKIALQNLDRAFGDSLAKEAKLKILRKSFQNMALSIMDLFIIEKVKKDTVAHFVLKGNENYQKALERNRGVVLVISHLGSWEYLAFLFYLTKTRGSAVVKKIRNPYIDAHVNTARQQTTLNPIQKKNSVREVLKELKNNNTVAVLIDQWAGPEGLWQEFFGEMTSTTSLPARLAAKTGCALLPAFCLRSGDGKFEIDVHPPVFLDQLEDNSDEAVTQLLTGILEKKIRQFPEQWSWGHRRFKPKPATNR